jgi:hypothetical protein
MRTRVVDAVVCVVAFVGTAVAQAPDNTPGKSKSPAERASPAPAPSRQQSDPTLDQLLEQALRNNPDMRVAEAKVREAEAELDRIRLQVTQRVISLQPEIAVQKVEIEQHARRHAAMEKLVGQGRAGVEGLDSNRALLERAKAKLAALEAEMTSLVGKSPRPIALKTVEITLSPADLANVRVVNVQPFKSTVSLDLASEPAPGSMAEKIRRVLDKPISLKMKGVLGPEQVISAVRTQVPDVPFHVVGDSRSTPNVSLEFEQISLGAALQAIEDSFTAMALRFYVRDYGILATMYDPPQGGILVQDFWKNRGADKSAKPTSRAPGGPIMPPPALEGTVKAIDSPGGIVTISIGSDAGIRPGQVLEVYRTGPEPKYLGRLEIVGVDPAEANGKLTSPQHDKVQIGDRVTPRVR